MVLFQGRISAGRTGRVNFCVAVDEARAAPTTGAVRRGTAPGRATHYNKLFYINKKTMVPRDPGKTIEAVVDAVE